MFLGMNNQYCENDYITKCNLQIQCNPYQITNGIFHRTRTKKFTIHMETQKTPNSQISLEKEEWSWRNQPAWLQISPGSASSITMSLLSHREASMNIPWTRTPSSGEGNWKIRRRSEVRRAGGVALLGPLLVLHPQSVWRTILEILLSLTS